MSSFFADAIFWIAVACCTVAQAAILRSIIASPASADHSPSPGAARRAIEIAWAILPGIALAAVLVFTWTAIHASAAPSLAR